MRSSLAVSPSISRPAGMPVQAATTSAMSSAVTSSLTRSDVLAGSAARPPRPAPARAAGMSAYSSRDAVSKSPSRWARSTCPRRSSIRSLSSPTRFRPRLLPLPTGVERVSCSVRSASSARSRASRSTRRLVVLLGERHLLHPQPVDRALQLVDLDRSGVDLHAQPRRRLVDEVDRLVGQEARGDVAVGQRRRRRRARRR